MQSRYAKFLTGLAAAVIALPVLAHSGHHTSQMSSLVSGFAHPFTGLDHLLAMLAVGFAAAQMRRAIVPMALAFISFMLAGGLAGLADINVPHVETGIALSVLVLGGVLMAAPRIPLLAGAGLVAVFAVFHGHAHGAQMPLGISPVLYFAGFTAGTLGLHLAGYSVGRVLREKSITWWPRLSGAGMAGVGVLMLLGIA